jgi:hypothetical protein
MRFKSLDAFKLKLPKIPKNRAEFITYKINNREIDEMAKEDLKLKLAEDEQNDIKFYEI